MKHITSPNFTYSPFEAYTRSLLVKLLESMQTLLLFFPLVFAFGLLPQLNTFALSCMEQIEMYVFGGTAQMGVVSALLNILRSCVAIAFLTSILTVSAFSSQSYEAASSLAHNARLSAKQGNYSTSLLFSAYCACSLVVAYLMSRQTSDVFTVCEALFEKALLKLKWNKRAHKHNGKYLRFVEIMKKHSVSLVNRTLFYVKLIWTSNRLILDLSVKHTHSDS